MTKAQDELGDFGEDLDSQETVTEPSIEKVEPSEKGVEVGMKFPPGTDPEVIRKIMEQVGRQTAKMAASKSEMDKQKEKYQAEGHRRWRCTVHSMREGMNHFEVTVPHPKTDKPVTIRGYCGVIIEEGLPLYAIECLKYDHSFRMEKIPNPNLTASLALTMRAVKMRHYDVEVHEEVENPKPIGSIGREVAQGV